MHGEREIAGPCKQMLLPMAMVSSLGYLQVIRAQFVGLSRVLLAYLKRNKSMTAAQFERAKSRKLALFPVLFRRRGLESFTVGPNGAFSASLRNERQTIFRSTWFISRNFADTFATDDYTPDCIRSPYLTRLTWHLTT